MLTKCLVLLLVYYRELRSQLILYQMTCGMILLIRYKGEDDSRSIGGKVVVEAEGGLGVGGGRAVEADFLVVVPATGR